LSPTRETFHEEARSGLDVHHVETDESTVGKSPQKVNLTVVGKVTVSDMGSGLALPKFFLRRHKMKNEVKISPVQFEARMTMDGVIVSNQTAGEISERVN